MFCGDEPFIENRFQGCPAFTKSNTPERQFLPAAFPIVNATMTFLHFMDGIIAYFDIPMLHKMLIW